MVNQEYVWLISHHLPVFCTIENNLPMIKEIKYYRDFTKFDSDLFLGDIQAVDFSSLIVADVNQSMNNLVSTMQAISDKHAPLRRLSNKEIKKAKKPWITRAILTSVKKKQKLFKTHFLSRDPAKVRIYKTYNLPIKSTKDQIWPIDFNFATNGSENWIIPQKT